MATIPLVALNVKPPAQQPDLLDSFSRLQQIRASQAQQAMQQQEAPVRQQILGQQAQTGKLALQQQQQDQKDQLAQTAAFNELDPKDPDSLPKLILKNGGSGAAAQAAQAKIQAQRLQATTILKNQADAGKATVEANKMKGDQLAGALTPLTDPSQVPDAQLPQALTQSVQGLVQNGTLDPQHAQAASQLLQSGDPAKIRQGLSLFIKTNQAQSQILQDAHVDAQTQQAKAEADKIKASTDPTSPLYAPSAAAVAMGTAPGAQQIQAGEVAQAGKKAAAEENARMPGEVALARQRQALSQGDPSAAAQLLVNGDATLSELKARGATPDFIARTLFSANRLSGGKYNAQSADAQFQVAKSPANVAFFGSAKSLTDKGGTLDQLANAAKDIPNGKIPVFNSVADVAKAATGDGPIAKYASILLGVSDDYSKVMGGGNGSDSSRAQALKLVPANASPEARAASIEGIRGAVGSQINSRIGNNPVLGRMYGTPKDSAPSAAAPSTHAFSLSAWQKANPQGDPKAAAAAAQQAGYQVTQ